MKVSWEHILQNKFNHLLVAELIILFAFPLLHSYENKFPILSLLLLAAIAPALWVGLSPRIFIAVSSIGLSAFLFNLFARFTNAELEDDAKLVLLILYAVFFLLAIVILTKKISSNTVITSDTIKGGISIYFLLGFLWAVLYMILLTYDENAITNFTKGIEGFDSYYYSFVTLTTLGYGDMTPVTKYAKILSILEAVTGPVYLAIFVAQIIGLNIAQRMKG